VKIGRFDDGRATFWGVLEDDTVLPVAGDLPDWAPALADGGGAEALAFVGDARPLSELRPRAPLTPAARVFGVGSTYREHVEKIKHVVSSDPGQEHPRTPGGFVKPHAAVVDPGGEIGYPATTSQLDYEIEIVVVVGRALEHGPAIESVLGYTIGNDVSARDAMSRHGGPDYFSMKCLDRTAPVGPWITTRDELGGDAHPDLELRLSINGELRQHDRTSSMVWTVDELIAYVNERVKVQPGDLLFTGTTHGVGWENGRFLQPGDSIEASIEGIGTLANMVGPKP
jgi:2-keto-4-pentenoate hydratase/2-oxohepta-3-ene-1,7-dioic acid hydratase in catechol pathway